MRVTSHRCLISLLLAAGLWTRPLFAAETRHAEGHVHGVAEINIVVEANRIVVELRTPTEGLMGFEHEARTDAEKRKRDAALKTIERRFDEMIILDKKLACASQSGKVDLVRSEGSEEKHKAEHSGDHSEVHATFHYKCRQPPDGSRVKFGVTKLFPDVHELRVQVVGNVTQLGATIKNDRGEVTL